MSSEKIINSEVSHAEIRSFETAYKSIRPNHVLSNAYFKAAEEFGLNPGYPQKPGRGSTDFGDVSQRIPGLHAYFGIAKTKIPLHSVEFQKAAQKPYGLERMLLAGKALALVGFRFFTDKRFRADVRQVFEQKQCR